MHISSVDLNLLPVLHVLLSEKSVTASAARLHLSQSAVSHALGRLRVLFDDPLLVRSGRVMLLTPRGERLAAKLADYVQSTEALLGDEEGFQPRSHAQVFSLAATDYVEWLLLSPLVERLRLIAPRVKLRIRPLQTSQIDADLASGRIDLAIGFIPNLHPGVHSRVLLQEQFMCVVGKGSALARGKLTMAKYLAAAHVQISPDGLFSGPPDAALAELGHTRDVVVSTARWITAYRYIAGADLVLTTQRALAMSLRDSLPVRLFFPPFAVPATNLFQVWHPRTNADAAHRWLRSVLLELAPGVLGSRR